jgi:hypothetical protein
MIAKSGEPLVRGDWIPLRAQRLEIDVFLDGLPPSTFSSKVSNIHVESRRWIILAVEQACLDLEKRQIAERELGAILQNREDAARALAKLIADFLQASPDWRVAPGFGYRASRMNYTQHNDVAKATHAALDAIVKARDGALKLAQFAGAERERFIPPHASGDIWRQGFVALLCFSWRHMTDRDPTPDGDRFRAFVEKCYASLAGNDSTASCADDENELPSFRGWTGVIRTVVKDLKSRPDWNGLARHERSLDPTGSGFEAHSRTFAEHRVRHTAMRNAEIAALAAEPGVRELFERLVTKHPDGKPRKKSPK